MGCRVVCAVSIASAIWVKEAADKLRSRYVWICFYFGQEPGAAQDWCQHSALLVAVTPIAERFSRGITQNSCFSNVGCKHRFSSFYRNPGIFSLPNRKVYPQ